MGGRTSLQGNAEQMDKQFNDLVTALAPTFPPPDPDIKREDKTVDGVPIRIFTPPGSGSGKKPLGVYAHGGGFVTGNIDSEAVICDAIAKNADVIVVSVEYGLAPALTHPAALEDCMKAYKWAYANADALGADQSNYFSVGQSAGGGLALSMANRITANEGARHHIKGCVAVVPVTLHPDNVPSEYQSQHTAYKDNEDAPVINGDSMRSFYCKLNGPPPLPNSPLTPPPKQSSKPPPPTPPTSPVLPPITTRTSPRLISAPVKGTPSATTASSWRRC